MVKAAVCYGAKQKMVIEDINIRETRIDEVRVDIKACAICHTDILYVSGDWGHIPPTVYGHEASGVVTDIGKGVNHVKVGDYVVVSLIRACKNCKHCNAQQEPCCTTTFPLDHATPLSTQQGQPLAQGVRTGAFAEQVLVHKSQVVSIPKNIPFESACLLACGVITGFGAVTNTVNVQQDSNIAIIGTGGVGINAVQGGKFSKARTVIAVDLDDEKLKIAKSFGATHIINPKTQDLKKRIAELTDGEMLDYVFMCVASGKIIETAYSLLGKRGTVVCVGIPATGDNSTFSGADLGSHSKSIIGAKMGSTTLSVDIPKIISSYNNGDFKLDELVSGRYALKDINEAFEATKNGGIMRNVIVF